jgi:hypothetical protein
VLSIIDFRRTYYGASSTISFNNVSQVLVSPTKDLVTTSNGVQHIVDRSRDGFYRAVEVIPRLPSVRHNVKEAYRQYYYPTGNPITLRQLLPSPLSVAGRNSTVNTADGHVWTFPWNSGYLSSLNNWLAFTVQPVGGKVPKAPPVQDRTYHFTIPNGSGPGTYLLTFNNVVLVQPIVNGPTGEQLTLQDGRLVYIYGWASVDVRII